MTTTTINCTDCNWTTDVEEHSTTNPRTCPKCHGQLVYTGTTLPFLGHGTVEWKGQALALKQDAYLDGDGNTEYYRAAAVAADGSEHTVFWAVYDNYKDFEDGSDHCDWDAYTVDCR